MTIFCYPISMVDCDKQLTFYSFAEMKQYFDDNFAAANDGKTFETEDDIRGWIDSSSYLKIAGRMVTNKEITIKLVVSEEPGQESLSEILHDLAYKVEGCNTNETEIPPVIEEAWRADFKFTHPMREVYTRSHGYIMVYQVTDGELCCFSGDDYSECIGFIDADIYAPLTELEKKINKLF